jgi:hypothetical protein
VFQTTRLAAHGIRQSPPPTYQPDGQGASPEAGIFERMRVQEERQYLVVSMNGDRKRQMRRRSMQGTLLFGLGIIAAIGSVVTGSVWLVCAALVFLVPGAVMLYQVGRSLR